MAALPLLVVAAAIFTDWHGNLGARSMYDIPSKEDEKIEYVKIDTDSAYDNNRAAVTIDGEVYYVVGDPIYFESEEIESMTFLEHAVPYIESKPEAGYYDPDLEMKYAKVDEGIVVLYMTEWYLCVPADTAISD